MSRQSIIDTAAAENGTKSPPPTPTKPNMDNGMAWTVKNGAPFL
jgi:hypothetical protein